MSADVFISYARVDRDYADVIAMALKTAGLRVWWDANLLPGLSFERQILEALHHAPIVVAVLSPNSIQSAWVGREIQFALDDRLIVVPVLAGGLRPEQLPAGVSEIQSLILDETRLKDSANEIVRRLETLLKRVPRGQVAGDAGLRLAQASAETAREASSVLRDAGSSEPPASIFVVHGHDDEMREAVTSELKRLGVEAVVLRWVRTSDDNLFAKFKAIAGKAKHAIVLISGDDIGASFRDFTHPAGGAARLEFRARQNVVLELGYFYGKLGEEHVFVFRKGPPITEKVVNRFEDPSDLAGRIFEDFSSDWQAVLQEKLRDAGFVLAT
jgi:predicted nucleotide-binding protein